MGIVIVVDDMIIITVVYFVCLLSGTIPCKRDHTPTCSQHFVFPFTGFVFLWLFIVLHTGKVTERLMLHISVTLPIFGIGITHKMTNKYISCLVLGSFSTSK